MEGNELARDIFHQACQALGWALVPIVALALSSPAPAAAYLRWKRWIDRAAGGVMGLLGMKLILTRPEA